MKNGKWDWDLSGNILSVQIEGEFMRLVYYSDSRSELIIKIGERITVGGKEIVKVLNPDCIIPNPIESLRDWFSRIGIREIAVLDG